MAASIRLPTLGPRVSLSLSRQRLPVLREISKRCMFSNVDNNYDLVVIGGGSGGLACSKEAARLGKKVAVLDYVRPSTQGTKWGLGGTCVNVGCIPKKLMHQAALLGNSLNDARAFGWDVPLNVNFSWEKLSGAVQNYVRSLNFAHRVQLKDKNVIYMNALGSLLDEHTVKAVDNHGEEHILKAKQIVIAVGGRPHIPDEIEGARQYALSSDDIFWKRDPPGKTLVVGGSYIALECGGFLTGLGINTTIMVRSLCLRSFDQEMAQLVTDHMESVGTRFLLQCKAQKITRDADGRLVVTFINEHGETREDVFKTVLIATGRKAQTGTLNLQELGVELVEETGKIVGGYRAEHERTAVPNIFAVGDVLEGQPELTPVAIKAGILLARRLYSDDGRLMDYDRIPTTVFTPLEFGTVGMSEEEALEKYGEEALEVYHTFYKPLEFMVPGRDVSDCYIKVICLRDRPQKILGMHIVGPNAGEIMQGFAVAMRCSITFEQMSSTLGIHPTVAEEIVKLTITKRSGLDPIVSGC